MQHCRGGLFPASGPANCSIDEKRGRDSNEHKMRARNRRSKGLHRQCLSENRKKTLPKAMRIAIGLPVPPPLQGRGRLRLCKDLYIEGPCEASARIGPATVISRGRRPLSLLRASPAAPQAFSRSQRVVLRALQAALRQRPHVVLFVSEPAVGATARSTRP